jgi:hypothetical protein
MGVIDKLFEKVFYKLVGVTALRLVVGIFIDTGVLDVSCLPYPGE